MNREKNDKQRLQLEQLAKREEKLLVKQITLCEDKRAMEERYTAVF